MTTAERAEALASAARHFPLLGNFMAEDLIELVRLELGHPEILDGFRPYAGHFSHAVPAGVLLHIVSGNTPHAALQSLVRGLLLGAQNYVKIPSSGLDEAEEFCGRLPPGLRGRISLRRDLPDEWLHEAAAWVVFGADETIAHFRRLAPREIIFEPHGHRISIGVVFDDASSESAPHAAADVSRFDQKGCLSPHDIYVAGDARNYAAILAAEMEQFNRSEPRGPVTVYEAAQIADLRANYRFRSANDSRVQIWESRDSTAWTVIYEEDPWFAASCLNRVVFVKPLPDDLPSALGPAASWLAAIGLWPPSPKNADQLASLRPSRICSLGHMQDVPISWHQEGRKTLVPFVRWVDFQP